MNNKLILGVLIVLLVIGVVFFVRMNQNNYQTQDSNQNSNSLEEKSQQSQGSNEQTQMTDTNSNQDTGKITEAVLAQHNSKNDCWVSYKSKVYDITSFLPRHPGSSAAIEPYCGTASGFEKAFTKQHGTSKVSMLMKVGTFIGDFDVMGTLSN